MKMTDLKRSLVVIPARGGSKRLPRKNVLDLAGKPLIAHSIEAALAADCFGQVLVSTDDPEIRSVAECYPGVLVDDRDPGLAGDKVKVVDVIHEICQRPEAQAHFDVIAMMLPTAPFRRVADIRRGMAKLQPGVDAVISFAPYDFPPQMAVSLDGPDAIMHPLFDPSPLISGNTRSQDQVPAYRPNGSFFITWIASFLKLKSFYTGQVRGVVMTRPGSTDIDEHDDLVLARMLAQSGLAESDFV
jgi:N-acylneuraminate cytidylyltransferase